jgi:hypothetical protein
MSGIEPRIVLRASAIGRCELAVMLSARMIYSPGAGECYWRNYGGMRGTPFGGCNKGNNNRPFNQRLRGRMKS